MAVWETEDETDGPVSPAAAPLPTPTDTPYRTPSRASKRSMSRTSKRSRRSVTPPRPTTSPPLPGTDKTDKTDKSSKRSSRDLATDDTISILDPRRFTPTLHANLVSEILSLRRDQEEKLKIIESLETALHTSREEQEFLQDTATTNAKETRSLKRQLALLEGGTSSAIGELSRERDEAAETANETKKRLDAAQKKVRHHEEDSERTHQQWAREKEAWDDEKRKLERKIHVAESRLKMVLDEFAALHSPVTNGMNGANGVNGNGNGVDSEAEEGVPAGKESDVASVRTMSMTNSIRFSLMSVRANINGHSLADELNFDGDDDYDTDNGGRDSVLSNFHNRNQSRDSIMSRTHRRNQSNDSLRRPGSVARGRFLNQTVLERLEGVIIPEDEEDQTLLANDEPAESVAGSIAESVAGSGVDSAPESIAETIVEPAMKSVDEPIPEAIVVPMVPKVEYTDSAVQYSPPPSPKLPPQPLPDLAPVPELPPSPVRSRPDRSSVDSLARSEFSEIEANQSRKRVHIARPLTIEPVIMGGSLMVSVGSQTTLEEPLTPPKTPKYPPFEKEEPEEVEIKPEPVAMVANSTQTDPALPPTPPMPPLCLTSQISLSQIAIPSISIHPPTSRPTTPRESLLPPLFKDFGCQVQIAYTAPCKSVSVQTEEIRVDKRLDRLPPHLHPSAISSRPSSPGAIIADPAAAAVDDLSKQPAPAYVPPRNPRRLAASARVNSDPPSSPPAPLQSSFILEEAETHDAYPGNNDDGPLSSQRAPMRRPHRISSLFAGFDGVSSDEADEFLEGELSDLEFRTALSAPKPKTGNNTSRANGKRNPNLASVPGSPASPDQITSLPRRSSTRNSERSSAMSTFSGTETYSKFSLADSRNSREYSTGRRMSIKGSRLSYEKGSGMGSGNRSSVMRKAAMIQNGIATHQGRARSPSLTDPRDPPFPIPTRASSRRPPMSVSAPSDGQRSPTRGDWPRRSGSRGHYRASSIRKVRSAAAIPVKPRSIRRGSRASVQRASIVPDEEEPESPGLPPLPDNDITSPRTNHGLPQRSRHRREMSTTTANTAITEQTNGSTNQATGVVDAIAQTMVGEWMYKYVRRRKSFGVGDAPNRDDSSNDRHRRWVWLAPYERAILWSSKQPSSNSMLMGKSGRKLTIQSVLDVKDDNPPPKGCPQLFNRSILILTPQRALKFTATTAERHYLWLTSLSFLAHSQQAVPENIAVTLPKAVPDFEPPRPRPRKNGIRDSIRLTKSKGAVIQSVQSGSAVLVQQVPPLPPMSIASSQTDSMPPSIPSYRPAESTMSAPSVAATSTSAHQRDISRDTAEPPAIQRFHDRANQALVHGRKRSNTGGHVPPPLSFRGFSGPSSGSYHHASTNSTAGNSDISQSVASTNVTWGMVNGMNGAGTLSSQRTSEASSRPSGAVMNNFFDAIGTVRMEAFISPLAMPQFDDYPDEQEEMRYRARRRSKEMRRRASRSRHRDSYHSRGTKGTDDYYSGSRTGGEEDYFRDDPFKGF